MAGRGALGSRPATRTVDAAALEPGGLAAPRQGSPQRTLVSGGVVRAEDFAVRVVDPSTAQNLAGRDARKEGLSGVPQARRVHQGAAKERL
ncbi:hypothetical protein ACH4TX_44070 [Streptomyces sp. NPDC021098]|uniref:hypothetical protein n=1 Tax=unclassified Streptomyces TaxID=2593676 RepID=UPI0037906857